MYQNLHNSNLLIHIDLLNDLNDHYSKYQKQKKIF
jgi:hypothetical protein